MTDNLLTQSENLFSLYTQFMEQQVARSSAGLEFMMEQSKLFMKKKMYWSSQIDQKKILEAKFEYWQEYFQMYNHFLTQIQNAKPIETTELEKNNPCPLRLENIESYLKTKRPDNRFLNNDWHQIPLFNFLMQNYLLFSKHIHKFVKDNETEDKKLNRQIDFFTNLWLDALSPSNYPFTNPEVLNYTLKRNGENLIQGMENYLLDLKKGNGQALIKMTDMNAFKLGENIATTPGKVIFRNKMMELIQYNPTTNDVFAVPLLMVPPWINKYYILDLKEKNSYVKWAVDQGFTVFMISWVNPDATYKETTFSDYMQEGLIEAINIVQSITNQKKINTLGFCIGGTLLSATTAYLKEKDLDWIESATYLTTLIDFSETGDVEVFIDREQIDLLNKLMEKEGVLDGKKLMLTFNLLRANELYWSFYINNYLFGKQPFAFDLLFWNCDSVNLPYKMHKFYLENMYLYNNLVKPNGITLKDTPIDLSKVDIPSYFLSTERDHIAPWKTTFKGAHIFSGDVTFVLGGSGHIAGVVNPPTNNKYGYKVSKNLKLYSDPEDWLLESQSFEGSWWPHWAKWLSGHSGEKRASKMPGSDKFEPITDAPGTYVRMKI